MAPVFNLKIGFSGLQFKHHSEMFFLVRETHSESSFKEFRPPLF